MTERIWNPKALPGYATNAYCQAAGAVVTMHTSTCDYCGGKHMRERKGTVSHGTMRYVDLIPTFWDYLVENDSDLELPIDEFRFYEVARDSDSDYDLPAGCEHLLATLFDAMNDLAPEGYYFGAHEGDGSDYGFWEIVE